MESESVFQQVSDFSVHYVNCSNTDNSNAYNGSGERWEETKALKRKLIPDVCQCYQDQPDFLYSPSFALTNRAIFVFVRILCHVK